MPSLQEHLRLRMGLSAAVACAGLIGLTIFSGVLDVGGYAFFLALLAFPIVPYMVAVRTYLGSLVCGLIMVLGVVSIQQTVSSAWDAGSSTASLGYLFIPMWGPVLVAVVAVWERLARNR